MNTTLNRWLLLGLAALAFSATAQVANEGLANSIIAARKKNAQMMQQYSWNCRVEVLDNGKVKDTRIEQCVYGANNQIQRTLLNDTEAPLPRGFVRRRIAEREREDTEKHLKQVVTLLDQYTLPTAGAVINFISAATIPAPGPNGEIQISGTGVVNPGDSLSLTIYAPSRATRKVTISTADKEGNAINVTATFRTMASGLNHLQFATIEIPSKNLTLQVHNYDYISQN